MSWNIQIHDNTTGRPRQFESAHQLVGSTYELGGSRHAEINITYNYNKSFKRAGLNIRKDLNDQPVGPVKRILASAASQLGTATTSNYYEPDDGNAGAALADLLVMCTLCQDTDIIVVS